LSWSQAFAVSENTLEPTLEGVILPFYSSQLQSGVFQGKDDVAMSYVKQEVPDEKGAQIISSGWAESHIKYAELIDDLGSSTNQWFREALKAARQATESADALRLPVLLLQAEMDAVVRPDAQDEFCRKAKDCTRITQPGARDEILMERDEVRGRALDHILDFLNAHAPAN
jgi:hypothetical protein